MAKKIKDLYGNKYRIHCLYDKGDRANIVRDVTIMNAHKSGLTKLKVKMIGSLYHFSWKLLYELLCKHYDVEFSEQPELLIYSYPSAWFCPRYMFFKNLDLPEIWTDAYSQKEHMQYGNCIKLLWKVGINENGYDDEDYDYAVGFPHIQGENFQYFNMAIPKSCYGIKRNYDECSLNRKFCSYLYLKANWGEGAKLRNTFIKELSDKYKKVDCMWDTATHYNYKFMIAFENFSIPGYVSGTLWNAYCLGVVPIYWGAPDICSELGVNPDSFIDCTKFGTDVAAMIKEVERIDQDDELYMYMLNQSPFVQGINYSTDKLERFLCSIAEQARIRS